MVARQDIANNLYKVDSYVTMLTGFKSKAISKIEQGVDDSSIKRLLFHIYNNEFILLTYNYTIGVPISGISKQFFEMLEDLKNYLPYCGNLAPDETLEQYIDCLRLLSFCYFFKAPQSDVERLSSYIPFSGKDMLIDRLIAASIPGYPIAVNEFVFPKVYKTLAKALSYDQSTEERIKKIISFLKDYYSLLEKYDVSWHDSHKEINPVYFRYIGYWIFELGALAADIGWDDTAYRDHEMYPKDLVDWKFAQRPDYRRSKI